MVAFQKGKRENEVSTLGKKFRERGKKTHKPVMHLYLEFYVQL